jgi:hypothetical protein
MKFCHEYILERIKWLNWTNYGCVYGWDVIINVCTVNY